MKLYQEKLDSRLFNRRFHVFEASFFSNYDHSIEGCDRTSNNKTECNGYAGPDNEWNHC